MSEIKLPFGRAPDGSIISIQAVVRGLACECTCPKCNRPLVACKGEIVRPYFRHYAEISECEGARETALHMFAKQLIARERRLVLPNDLGKIVGVSIEAALPFGRRPDVLIEYQSSETVAVEIWVAHQVEADKVKLYAEHNQTALEIDLRPYRFVDEADWPKVILKTARRWWTYPPLVVRIEREQRRQEILNQMREVREKAVEAMEQADAQVIHEQRKLKALKLADDIRQQSLEIDAKIALQKQKTQEAEYQQAFVKKAEERAKTAELRAAIKARRERERIPPDLQELVAAFGTYTAITAEAWIRYQSEMEQYKNRIQSGYFYEPTAV